MVYYLKCTLAEAVQVVQTLLAAGPLRLEEGCGPSEGLVQAAGCKYGLGTSLVFQTAVGVGKAPTSST